MELIAHEVCVYVRKANNRTTESLATLNTGERKQCNQPTENGKEPFKKGRRIRRQYVKEAKSEDSEAK